MTWRFTEIDGRIGGWGRPRALTLGSFEESKWKSFLYTDSFLSRMTTYSQNLVYRNGLTEEDLAGVCDVDNYYKRLKMMAAQAVKEQNMVPVFLEDTNLL